MALEAIVHKKREQVAARMSARPLAALAAGLAPSDRSLLAAMGGPSTKLILECKHAAPSSGVLRSDYDPARIAREYAPVAAAISVLADEPFFMGSLEHVRAVRDAVALPVLCKDFVVDPYQVWEARAYGADAILLMAAVLDRSRIEACLAAAAELHMDVLFEVHDEGELALALDLGVPLIGINNRNLKTLAIDLDTTRRLAPRVPSTVRVISESGIRGRSDLKSLSGLVNGFLVGSSMMRAPHPGQAARQLIYGNVKICGLTTAADARVAWECGAVYGGVIFAKESPRAVSQADAGALVAAAPGLAFVGVFVNQPIEEIVRTVDELGLSAVQLHGEESPNAVRAVKAVVGCEVWRAVRVQGPLPLPEALGADRLVCDAYVAGQRGGTGQRFDLRLIEQHPAKDRLILAGGLGPANILDAEQVGAFALDVNSGVEALPGIKSRERMAALFSALRGAGRGAIHKDS